MTQTTTNHAHQISHPEKVKIKFMYCLHSISLTFKAGPCHNLCSCYMFHNKQKKNRTTTTTNDIIQKSVRMTHWIEDFGLRISLWSYFAKWHGCSPLVRLICHFAIKCDQTATCCQVCHRWLIHGDKYAVKWRKTATTTTIKKGAHTNNKTSVSLKPADIQ